MLLLVTLLLVRYVVTYLLRCRCPYFKDLLLAAGSLATELRVRLATPGVDVSMFTSLLRFVCACIVVPRLATDALLNRHAADHRLAGHQYTGIELRVRLATPGVDVSMFTTLRMFVCAYVLVPRAIAAVLTV